MTGIELLQMIKDGKLEEDTEINVLKFNEEYCCHDVVAKLKYSDDDLHWSPGTFTSSMLWDNSYSYEIVGYIIKERYQYSLIPSYCNDEKLIRTVNRNFEQHQKAINELIDAVNYLLDTQNKN